MSADGLDHGDQAARFTGRDKVFGSPEAELGNRVFDKPCAAARAVGFYVTRLGQHAGGVAEESYGHGAILTD